MFANEPIRFWSLSENRRPYLVLKILEGWMKRHVFGAVLMLLIGCAPLLAQQTTGNVTGRVLDEQGAAVPGATVTAKNPATGFTRTETTDNAGVYRLSALPIGL